jgi:hypothetical protein
MQDIKAIKTTKYLSVDEIKNHLENVEYIIMAAPSPNTFEQKAPIHFTIFLNTQEELPNHIKDAVLEKFLKDYKITDPIHIMSQLSPVGFATTKQETPMPMLLVQPQDIYSIPHIFLHVIDFLANSDSFKEVKEKSLTGWSYSYEKD